MLRWTFSGIQLALFYSFFHMCESFSNSDNPFTQPGVIAGIIVGIVGLLVIIGVTIVLCRIFCFHDTACCSCCCCCLEQNDSTDYLSNAVPPKTKDVSSSNNELNNTLNYSHSNINNSHSHSGSPDSDDEYATRVSNRDRNLQKGRSRETVHNILSATSARSLEKDSNDKNVNSNEGSNKGAAGFSGSARTKNSQNNPQGRSSSPSSSFDKHLQKLSKKWSAGRSSRNPFNFIRGSSPRSSNKSKSSFGKGKQLPEYDDLPQFNWNPVGDPQSLSYSASFTGADHLPPIYGLKDKKRKADPTKPNAATSVFQGAEYSNTAYDMGSDADHPAHGEDSDTDAAMAFDIATEISQADILPKHENIMKGYGSSASAGQFAYVNYNFDDEIEPPSARSREMIKKMHKNTMQEDDSQRDTSSRRLRMLNTDLDEQTDQTATVASLSVSTRDLTSHMQSQLSSQDNGHTILWGNLSPKAASTSHPSFIHGVMEAHQPYGARQAFNETYGVHVFQPLDAGGLLAQDRMANPHFKAPRTTADVSKENSYQSRNVPQNSSWSTTVDGSEPSWPGPGVVKDQSGHSVERRDRSVSNSRDRVKHDSSRQLGSITMRSNTSEETEV